MEKTDRPVLEQASEENIPKGRADEKDLAITEIDIEEVAIDGICGVY
jgi:mycofactocin precursor